ncbi:MAG TPA: hypothetical protein VFI27_00910 [candidate division Zixibacteria bacterium]|nr:hypothetical protein [candidate division Zixibacteria bacterium]
MTTGGVFPELGDYGEHFYCELYAPHLGGELVTRVDAGVVASLMTVKLP